MIQVSRESLKPLASKYIWWKTPDKAVAMPQRVIAQVVNIGDYFNVQVLASQVGDEVRAKFRPCRYGDSCESQVSSTH